MRNVDKNKIVVTQSEVNHYLRKVLKFKNPSKRQRKKAVEILRMMEEAGNFHG